MKKSKLKNTIVNLEIVHKEASDALLDKIKENKELKNILSSVESDNRCLQDELQFLRGFHEGVKNGAKVNFSPTINQPPKKEFPSGGEIAPSRQWQNGGVTFGVDHGTKPSVGVVERVFGKPLADIAEKIEQEKNKINDLSPELRAECEKLKKPDLKNLDDDFKQQPFNNLPETSYDSKVKIERHDHDKDGSYYGVESIDFLYNILDEKKEFFYFLRDKSDEIKIIQDLNDLRFAQNNKRPILFRWVRK